jgi:hypothetical protein
MLVMATAGTVLSTQLGRISETTNGMALVNGFALASMDTTLGGLLIALVGSVVWARRDSFRQPLWAAMSIGVGSSLLALGINVNIHAPSGILEGHYNKLQ